MNEEMCEWRYLRSGPMMVSADQMANPLNNTELGQYELLIRESVQNSCDEVRKDNDEPVRIRIESKDFRGEEKNSLVMKLRLQEIVDRSKFFNKEDLQWFRLSNTCLVNLDDSTSPIRVLVISDFNANGLGGAWNKPGKDSRFHNLVLSLNAGQKYYRDENMLGSYGIGKMVFARCSRLRTISYYSNFPTEDGVGESTRLMTTAFLPRHEIEGVFYSGHAFFGIEGMAPYPSAPLEDESAHKEAEKLGFESRRNVQTGTSIMIVDTNVSVQEYRNAIEDYWWPRLLEKNRKKTIEFELIDNGRKTHPPNPQKSPDLRPFIDCWNNVRNRVAGRNALYERLSGMGDLGLKIVRGGDVENRFVNRCALIRQGMVIQYNDRYHLENEIETVGVFEAGEGAKVYALSEPEAHDRWNPKHARISDVLWGQSALISLVERTHFQIRKKFRAFQKTHGDALSKTVGDGLDFIEESLTPLSRLFTINNGPSLRDRAINVKLDSKRIKEENRYLDEVKVEIILNPNLNEEVLNCIVRPSGFVLSTVDGLARERLTWEAFDQDGKTLSSNKEFQLGIKIDHSSSFYVRSIVELNWRTKWNVYVERSSR